ncbi:MAG: metallophosphoesterase, partial [Bacteroidota bacterium]|nr:metallophosphoesterase [Bacteroidota bacterium]
MEINIRGHYFQLLSHKAILWKETKTLLISDVHLGKISHFRNAGIAVPSAAYDQNFNRLSDLLLTTGGERIIFLGDLFHNRRNIEWEHFEQWRSNYSEIEMIVVLGNHDILPGSLFSENNVRQYPE